MSVCYYSKRVERHIRKRIPDEELTQEEVNRRLLKGYFDAQPKEDGYLLDSENAIIVRKNKEEDKYDGHYVMIHQRLVDRNLVEINRWYLPGYYFGSIHNISVIKDFDLFKVQNGMGDFGSLYDYKNGKFIVPQGAFAKLDFGCHNEILKEYHGVIGSFSICSDYKKYDSYSYVNAITGKVERRFFKVRKGDYYGMLNLDGSIRGNQLFRGILLQSLRRLSI